jgi:hypothetical protein
MTKTCFIIMPISDHDGYPKGHFKRVYDFLIKPACELAGFKPIRADDVLNTNYIALDIVKNIIEADMALCDLSSKNPNVLYELGIRQAFNKPVTLIKDSITQRIFDISGFRDVEYDESLRIDSVQTSIEAIADTIKNTFETAGREINSLVTLLGIEPAKVNGHIEISMDTELIMNSISSLELRLKELDKKLSSNNIDTSLNQAQLIQEELGKFSPLDLNVGDRIVHPKFGKGVVKKLEGSTHNPVGTFEFEEIGLRKLMLNYAKFSKETNKN